MYSKCPGIPARVESLAPLVVVGHLANAATAPELGNAESFVVLGAAAVSNAGTSAITGDLGIAPELAAAVSRFPPGLITGASRVTGNATAAAARFDAPAPDVHRAGPAAHHDLTSLRRISAG